ncbi:MAG: hypothetical protein ACW960_01540 [Candidatus Thorarchaeota archaeon]|jgi:hypothetical protein
MQLELLANSIALLEIIPVILVMLLTLWGVFKSTGRSRILSLLALLISLLFATTWLSITLFKFGLITATDWANWAVYVDFGLRGIYYFLILVYVTIWAFPDFFSVRKWAVIVALIGPILFEVLMYLNFGVSNIYAPAFWFTMLILTLLYMAVIPLIATIRRTQQDDLRGSPQVKWIWLVFVGLLFWFFGEALIAIGQSLHLPGYASLSSELAIMTISAHAIGWYLIMVGFVFQGRTSQSSTS